MAPLTVTWCTVPFKNRKSLSFCLLLKLTISYFSDMWKLRHLSLHKRRIYRPLTNFSVLPFLLFPMAKSVHMWPQLDNEGSNWFPSLHSIEQTCKFLLLIHHCSTKFTEKTANLIDLQKGEKINIMWEVVAKRCSAKSFLKISQSSQINTFARVSF